MAVMDRFYLLDQPSRFMHAVDLHASLEIPPAWRFSLTGHNLLDVDRISQRVPGPGSLSERSTALVGRYLQLRVAVDF
jgi:outer membrane receptor protein involved in Fe transport